MRSEKGAMGLTVARLGWSGAVAFAVAMSAPGCDENRLFGDGERTAAGPRPKVSGGAAESGGAANNAGSHTTDGGAIESGGVASFGGVSGTTSTAGVTSAMAATTVVVSTTGFLCQNGYGICINHFCALVNGGVWCWDSADDGYDRESSTPYGIVPVQVVGLTANVGRDGNCRWQPPHLRSGRRYSTVLGRQRVQSIGLSRPSRKRRTDPGFGAFDRCDDNRWRRRTHLCPSEWWDSVLGERQLRATWKRRGRLQVRSCGGTIPIAWRKLLRSGRIPRLTSTDVDLQRAAM